MTDFDHRQAIRHSDDTEWRLNQLESDAKIAAFHRRESREEWAILGAILQIGLCISGLSYAAIEFGWLKKEYFEVGGPIGTAALIVISFTLLANAFRSLQRVFASRRREAHPPAFEPAE